MSVVYVSSEFGSCAFLFVWILTLLWSLQMLPTVAYADNPSTSFAAKFVHTSLNKNRCSINRVLVRKTKSSFLTFIVCWVAFLCFPHIKSNNLKSSFWFHFGPLMKWTLDEAATFYLYLLLNVLVFFLEFKSQGFFGNGPFLEVVFYFASVMFSINFFLENKNITCQLNFGRNFDIQWVQTSGIGGILIF